MHHSMDSIGHSLELVFVEQDESVEISIPNVANWERYLEISSW